MTGNNDVILVLGLKPTDGAVIFIWSSDGKSFYLCSWQHRGTC